jgi:hypothetical protein
VFVSGLVVRPHLAKSAFTLFMLGNLTLILFFVRARKELFDTPMFQFSLVHIYISCASGRARATKDTQSE